MLRWFRILFGAARSWSDDNAFKHCAAVAFYTLFSLAPITVIVVGIAGFFLGKEEASRQFNTQVTQLVGKSSAEAIQQAMTSTQSHTGNWVSTVSGLVLLLVGATTVFGQLQDSLNEIWNVKAKPSSNTWVLLLLHRLLSFAMVLTVGFLLLVSLILTTALTSLTGHFGTEWGPVVAQGCDLFVSVVVITALFALIFKVLPDVELKWSDVWGGAILTSLFFTVGRYLIALYLGHSTVASIYGAAGSLVALLIWVYYSCAILFFGVEYIRASRRDRQIPLVPKKTAVIVRQEVVEQPKHPAKRTRGTKT